MARGKRNEQILAATGEQLTAVVEQATQNLPPVKQESAPQKPGLEIRLRKTGMMHIYNFDVDGDGRYREVALVKAVFTADKRIQSVYYVDTVLLDKVDQGRLKNIITNMHADKYELWDLMSQQTLSNGKNALDYFHQLIRTVHAPGVANTSFSGGLASVRAERNSIIGSEFSNPASASLDAPIA